MCVSFPAGIAYPLRKTGWCQPAIESRVKIHCCIAQPGVMRELGAGKRSDDRPTLVAWSHILHYICTQMNHVLSLPDSVKVGVACNLDTVR